MKRKIIAYLAASSEVAESALKGKCLRVVAVYGDGLCVRTQLNSPIRTLVIIDDETVKVTLAESQTTTTITLI